MARWWLILVLAIFLLATLFQLSLPGLHYDEAFEVVPAMQLLRHQPVQAFRDSTITLFGTQFPLTTQDYIGALNTYLSLPFLWLAGISVTAVRLYSVFVGLITVLLTAGFTADLTRNRWAGVTAAALLAVNPTFVFWTRQGIFVTAITAAIGIAATWSWLRWHRTRRYRWAVVGAFLFGLGIYAKLLFLWLIAALFGAYLLTLWRQQRIAATAAALRRDNPIARAAGLLIAGAVGTFPLILYNLQTGGTFKNIGQNAAISYYGVDNTAVLPNLATRFAELITLLDSGHFWYLGDVFRNPAAPIVWMMALLAAGWLAARRKNPRALIPFAVILLITVESIVTVSALWITHFAVMMAFPAIALAVTGAELWRELHPNRAVGIALGLMLAAVLLGDGITTARYHRALTVSGGLGDHSDAVYDMADWLAQHATDRPVVAMDWGLSAPVTFLTAGTVTPVEVFGYGWGDVRRFDAIISAHLQPRSAIFLWRAPDIVIFDRSPAFKLLYQPQNLEEDILAAFYDRSGKPLYGATELVPLGAAKNKPK